MVRRVFMFRSFESEYCVFRSMGDGYKRQLSWVIYDDGADNLLRMFRLLNPLWLIAAVLFMAVYWLLEAGILHRIIRRFHSVQKFKNSLCTSMIGQLFNCITPFASGGQPVQAYHMVKTLSLIHILGKNNTGFKVYGIYRIERRELL